LREFVNQMDLVDEHDDYFPMKEYGFDPGAGDLLPEEQAALSGSAPPEPSDDEADVATPHEDVW
jgi:hypothetical protein